jgi:hypothetical protein
MLFKRNQSNPLLLFFIDFQQSFFSIFELRDALLLSEFQLPIKLVFLLVKERLLSFVLLLFEPDLFLMLYLLLLLFLLYQFLLGLVVHHAACLHLNHSLSGFGR